MPALCSVFLFVLVFWLLKGHLIFLRTLFAMMGLVAFIMWFLKYYVLHSTSTGMVNNCNMQPKQFSACPHCPDSFLQSLLLLSFLSGISPVLKTLTQSISSDTIWLMTVCMCGNMASLQPLLADTDLIHFLLCFLIGGDVFCTSLVS